MCRQRSLCLRILPILGALCLVGAGQGRAADKAEASKTVRIASLSYIPVKWDKAKNLATLDVLAREAAEHGARILITPEGALEGYLIDELRSSPERQKLEPRFQAIAEPVGGPNVMRVRALARALEVDVVLGFLERDGLTLYNSCAWIDAQGEIVHLHRKTHMAQPYFDPENYHPGYELKAFDTRYGRMGMLICFERQIPEVAGALALDGAHVLINPSYGSRGEWNTNLLRARARDNSAYLVFTHPKQTLVLSPSGEVVVDVDREEGAGIVYADLEIRDRSPGNLAKRRPEVFAEKLTTHVTPSSQRLSHPRRLKVAAVQMRSTHNLAANVERISQHLARCATQGVRVAVFPECATSGYFQDDIVRYVEEDYRKAEQGIAAACQRHAIYAVVGTPYYENGECYNMALVIDPEGRTIYRQAKIQLVGGDEGWAQPGNRLGLFYIDGQPCSLIICHDSRYPELVRIPALKGSRLVFYLSWESDFRAEHKLVPYRAQVVARAVENNVYIVHANAPQSLEPLEGSHGQSRIVGPDGGLIQEASIFEEEVLIETLDLTRATGRTAEQSLRAQFLREWWEDGMERVAGAE